MRIALLAASALTLAFAAAPAMAQDTATESKPKATKKMDDPNRIVCTREHVVGSNRPQKVCMTVAERERRKDKTNEILDESRRTSGTESDHRVGNQNSGG